MFHPVNIIGLVAATLTTIAMLPQVIQIHRTRKTRDLSLPTFLLFNLGLLLWLIYGLLIHSLPLIAGNTVSLMLAGYILVMKVRHG
jgi:MtN3 and saliva related transmembrane protein